MIYDKIENLKNYFALDSKFETAYKMMTDLIAKGYEEGHFEGDDPDVFVNTSDYETKALWTAQSECHRKYIDIHFMFEGKEKILTQPIEISKALTEYEDDCQMFEVSEDANTFSLNEGYFLLVYPNEPHTPGINYDKDSLYVKKGVVKIKA